MITWRELKSFIDSQVTEEYLDFPVSVCYMEPGEFFDLYSAAVDERISQDILSENEPFLMFSTEEG